MAVTHLWNIYKDVQKVGAGFAGVKNAATKGDKLFEDNLNALKEFRNDPTVKTVEDARVKKLAQQQRGPDMGVYEHEKPKGPGG